ncbi:MAG: SGNH/GDSL hydrolase family protein [Chloroflexota bacterium]
MSATTLASRQTRRRGGRQLILARLLLVLLAILLPLATLEVGFRLAGPFIPGNYDTGSYLTRNPRYGHYHPASYSGWIKRDEYVVQVQTNPERQRGPAIPFEKPPGTFRILVLGDSFVEAVQVAERERFLAKLQDLLNANGGPTRYELIDGGCGGWGQVQELLYLQQEGPRYKPDLVLLAFFVGNDVNNNSYELELEGNVNAALKPYVERQDDGTLSLLEPSPPPLTLGERVGFFLRERSALYNVIESGVLQKLSLDDLWANWRDLDAQVELTIREAEVYSTRPDDRWKDAWATTDTLLGQIGQEASTQGARFGLMLVPTKAQVMPDAWRALTGSNEGRDRAFDPLQPNKSLAGIAQRTAAPLLDLTQPFRDAGRARGAPALYYARDQHWTAAGHDLAARTLADWLKRSGLIPS